MKEIDSMMQDQRGRFISIEGVEGVGKSTMVNAICDALGQQSIPHLVTREPGGTPVAEAIRDILLREHEESVSPDTELLLMFAGRVQNIQHVIMPALQAGQWVLTDRFTDASFAYQGGGRGIAERYITYLAEWVQGDLEPDLTFLLDAPVDVGFSRIKHRGEKDRIENEKIEFFERVRAAYLEQAKRHPERYRVIDATQEPSQVVQQVLLALQPLLESV